MGAVALREERQSLTIDSPVAIADLCSEMRFLERNRLDLEGRAQRNMGGSGARQNGHVEWCARNTGEISETRPASSCIFPKMIRILATRNNGQAEATSFSSLSVHSGCWARNQN